MTSLENSQHPENQKPSLMNRLAKSRIARVGAGVAAAGGLGLGVFEGGKAFAHSVNGGDATPVELVAHDNTGFLADSEHATGNNPDILMGYVKSLPPNEKPFFMVTDKDGKKVRVDITSKDQLVTTSFPQTGERLSLAGLTARDMYVRSHMVDLQQIETPELKVGDGQLTEAAAKEFAQDFYTGPSKGAPDLSVYKNGLDAQVADNVELVIPPQPHDTAK